MVSAWRALARGWPAGRAPSATACRPRRYCRRAEQKITYLIVTMMISAQKISDSTPEHSMRVAASSCEAACSASRKRVERARADIAIDDAERAERQRRCALLAVGSVSVGKCVGGCIVGADRTGILAWYALLGERRASTPAAAQQQLLLWTTSRGELCTCCGSRVPGVPPAREPRSQPACRFRRLARSESGNTLWRPRPCEQARYRACPATAACPNWLTS